MNNDAIRSTLYSGPGTEVCINSAAPSTTTVATKAVNMSAIVVKIKNFFIISSFFISTSFHQISRTRLMCCVSQVIKVRTLSDTKYESYEHTNQPIFVISYFSYFVSITPLQSNARQPPRRLFHTPRPCVWQCLASDNLF